jgi:hypothetical protein
VDVPPSPKVQEKEGVPLQPDGVAVAEKFTFRGAWPEVGEALAVQERVQEG